MARTCSSCGYTAQTDRSKRCVLCKEPFPEQERTFKLPSLGTSENQNDLVGESSQIGSRTIPAAKPAATPRWKPARAPARTRRNDLMIRRVVSFFTLLHGLLGAFGSLLILGMVLLGQLPVDLTILFLLPIAFFARGICGLIGAISLWRGTRIGFQLSIVCWFYNVVIGLIALTQFPFLNLSDPVMARHVGSTIGKLLFGFPILYFLLTRLLKWNVPSRG